MQDLRCELLEGYLGRWLSEPERSSFESHLHACPACRDAVAEARQLDGLLRDAAIKCTEVPGSVASKIKQRITSARRRRIRTAFALAASLILAGLVAGWTALHQRRSSGPVDEAMISAETIPAIGQPKPRRHAQVIMPPKSPLMPVPVRTDSPDVTIVWLFARGTEPQAAARPVSPSHPNRSKS
jgi:hypothetical protein